jgi:hypothetical protein
MNEFDDDRFSRVKLTISVFERPSSNRFSSLEKAAGALALR